MNVTLHTADVENATTRNFQRNDNPKHEGFSDVSVREHGGHPVMRITVSYTVDGINGARLLISQLQAAVEMAEASMSQQQAQPVA